MAQIPHEMEASAQTPIYQKLFDELLQVGTEGRPDSTETKNAKRGTISNYRVYRGAEGVGQKIKTQKEVRLDTTEQTVGRRGRGGAGEETHKEKYDLILQSTLEGGGGVTGEEKHKKILVLSPPAAGHRPVPPGTGRHQIAEKNLASRNPLVVATRRFFTAAVCNERILYYCFRHRLAAGRPQ